jgi:hypothetical protein
MNSQPIASRRIPQVPNFSPRQKPGFSPGTPLNALHGTMIKKRKLLRRLCVLSALLSVYPICVLVFTWSHVLSSDFEGGRHGPLDAYRHALASAVVSYTSGEWAVTVATSVLEWNDKDSNKMDRHNNRIGAMIGSRVESFRDIEPIVRKAVLNGEVGTTEVNHITWLAESEWRDGRLW